MDDCIDHGRKGGTFGYALKFVNGKQQLMHRIAYAEKIGIDVTGIERGLVVRHTCDNPRCINPEHLVIGTRADNSRDMVERNRQRKGSSVTVSILSEEDVAKIRSSTESNKVISEQYGVSPRHVATIRKGPQWKHVDVSVSDYTAGNTRGENNGNSVLTQKLVTDILSATGTQRAIAKRFGVSQTTVWNIRNRKTWKET